MTTKEMVAELVRYLEAVPRSASIDVHMSDGIRQYGIDDEGFPISDYSGETIITVRIQREPKVPDLKARKVHARPV